MVRITTCFAALLIAGSLVAAADLESSLKSLKEAEAQKDVALVKKLAAETSAAARAIVAEPKPDNDEAVELWKQHVAYARDVDVYSEYALFALAVQSKPETLLDLLDTLEQQNPKSKYLNDAWGSYMVAMHKTGAAAKIPEVAAKAITNFPDNADLLVVLADNAIAKQQNDRAAGYAERLVTVLNRGNKPGYSAALGRGYWISGVVHAGKNQYFEANKDLRAALPLIKGNDAMAATAFFHLGVVNYQLGRMTANKAQVVEAAKFSDQAAAIAGPLQQQAYRNAQVMRNELIRMR